MEWHLNIPKILHVYWGGGNFHYLRFLTIKTFIKYNPDWEIIFMYPKQVSNNLTWWNPEQKYTTHCTDFLPEVMKLPITKTEIDFKKYGFSNKMSEVHKSDFIRLLQLSTVGGVWSDMDIIYFKPMTSLSFNNPENKHIETFYCDHNYGHSVGFLMACQGNKFFGKLIEIAQKEHTPLEYQSMGAIIYKKYFSTSEAINALTPAMNIPMDVVYAHDATYFAEILTNAKPKFTKESIGLHWYAGASLWKDFLERTDGGRQFIPNSIIGNIIINER
jgi:mannosyltransferase OCH1-like enzyme